MKTIKFFTIGVYASSFKISNIKVLGFKLSEDTILTIEDIDNFKIEILKIELIGSIQLWKVTSINKKVLRLICLPTTKPREFSIKGKL